MQPVTSTLEGLRNQISSRVGEYWRDVLHFKLHKNWDDARDVAYKLQQMLHMECDILEELEQIKETPLEQPKVGDYYCLKESYKTPGLHLMIVERVTPPKVQLDGRYPTFDSGSIVMGSITVSGDIKERGIEKVHSYGTFARLWKEKIIRPAPYILKLDKMADEDIERVIPMLSFVPVPEGKHLNRYLLRSLARTAKRTHAQQTKKGVQV